MDLFDNSDRLARLRRRMAPYARLSWAAVRAGVPLPDLGRTQFPFLFWDARRPPAVSVEFTTACNLRCPYCVVTHMEATRKVMSWQTLASVAAHVRQAGIPRVRIGGGESTLHPKFGAMTEQLRAATQWMSIVTNAHWGRDEIPEILVRDFDLVEVSVDAGDAAQFEASRPRGSFQRLVASIRRLRECRDRSGSRAILNVRLMLRPSTLGQAHKWTAFWRGMVDTVMPQHLIHDARTPYRSDIFLSQQASEDAYPRCALPFKMMLVRANGDVPLCDPAGNTVMLGNVESRTLQEMWLGPEMRQYRQAHRRRDASKMPACRGCIGT